MIRNEIILKENEILTNELNSCLRNIANKDKEIKRLKEEYMILQNASDEVEEELQDRIDKAIEYIEENSDDIHTYISQILTDILKGSDKK